MEALAAISLAGNALQLFSFTGGVISKSRRIRTSISGLSIRLQASAGSIDSALEQLCSGCNQGLNELLNALEHLGVKGKHTRSQSLRKAFKVLWGKEKFQRFEKHLAAFRQELTLHTNLEIRSQIDASNVQQTEASQALERVINEGAGRTVEALRDNRHHSISTTDAQTRQLRVLHTQTETLVSQEFESAATNLAEQSETTRVLTAKEQQGTRTEVLNAVADAASGFDNAISTEAENISARIEEADGKYSSSDHSNTQQEPRNS